MRFNPERVSQQSLGSTQSGAPQVRDVRSLRTLKGFHKAAIVRSSSCGTPLGNAVKDSCTEKLRRLTRGREATASLNNLASRPRVKRFKILNGVALLGLENECRRFCSSGLVTCDCSSRDSVRQSSSYSYSALRYSYSLLRFRHCAVSQDLPHHHAFFEYEYEYRCTEYEYDFPAERPTL